MKGSNDKTMLSETRGLESSSYVEIVTHTLALAMDPDMIMFNVQWSMFNEDLSGGYCSGVPPLPIPNREVKPACADGTAMQCGRVGGRPLYLKALERNLRGFFVFIQDIVCYPKFL